MTIRARRLIAFVGACAAAAFSAQVVGAQEEPAGTTEEVIVVTASRTEQALNEAFMHREHPNGVDTFNRFETLVDQHNSLVGSEAQLKPWARATGAGSRAAARPMSSASRPARRAEARTVRRARRPEGRPYDVLRAIMPRPPSCGNS